MDLLIVYNTFGYRDNFEHYRKCIQSILDSKIDCSYRIVISSCCNSDATRQKLISTFGNLVDYSFISSRHTVNITFNATVRRSVKKYGEFSYYLYVDSGVDFIGNELAIQRAVDLMSTDEYGMLSFQIENDNGLHHAGIGEFPLRGRNHVIPLGSACNGHAEIFSNKIYTTYGGRLIPDVFAAFCTESVYSFLCAGIRKKWVVLGDFVLHHNKGIDGASSSQHHISPRFGNPWNNLLFGRNSLDFITSKEAIDAGLGYEECNFIMLHNKDAYVEDYIPKDEKALVAVINKYLFLTDSELNYETV